jgi:hypothetical protein
MSKIALPFLFRFAQQCLSPGRKQQNDEYMYDDDTDMVLWLGHESRPPVIDQAGEIGPMTKKRDLEKGDDAKDHRMWQ